MRLNGFVVMSAAKLESENDRITLRLLGTMDWLASTCSFGNSCSNAVISDSIAASSNFKNLGTSILKALASATLSRSFCAKDLIQSFTNDNLFSGPAALKRLSLGGDLSEVFRAALGRLFTTKPASTGGNEFIRNVLSAVWAFHREIIQHPLQLFKEEKCIKSCNIR